jgi:Histidine kinase
VIFVFHFASQNYMVAGYKEALSRRTMPDLLLFLGCFVPMYVVSAYVFMYIILPYFLFQRRISAFIFSFLVLLSLNFISAYYSGVWYIHQSRHIDYGKISFDANKYYAIVNGIWIPAVVFVLTGGIRMSKKWFLQERENEELEKQKISKELKLLKTQIHPRFLYHSLTSLEENLQKSAPDSPGFILKLADLLSYILYESENDQVLLEKEIEILRQYMDLQKNNYSRTLDVRMALRLKTGNIYIAPLILLPFLESCFEFYYFDYLQHGRMDVNLSAGDGALHFSLVCSRKSFSASPDSSVPVWTDIKKRLQNLYPNNHQLYIKTAGNDLTIDLQLNIEKYKAEFRPALELNAEYDY